VALRISRTVFSALSGMRLLVSSWLPNRATMSQESSLTQSGDSVRQTAYSDELFAGYPRYPAERLAAALRFAPPWAIDALGAALGKLRDSH
jgi:hypothetical protein